MNDDCYDEINMMTVMNDDFGDLIMKMMMMNKPVHLVPLADHTLTGFSLACE